ncbi:bifunctional demethylmenaquinone methyltransferase/2-methoxy-6-polyprenyl-1,4-benzoquinol methylase UbiE [Sanyastnella coralliicola]|uniref:bifunctional demethylmenaquinone methyltransferase/2-methoxy-6-polyprenyl-1,4-benzoquinol methylase UbiE n=1 Tax=Sanyastnella coralliicola TaxID=3069118 RepID=UPI0027B99B8D|nr:bifunctional demethylmenaquinone methyltransferase/2-methoxy-6-polyprenyl-1,4-benzoquinol methylase UbiE [Longitalea sp. SCSIO 12813]
MGTKVTPYSSTEDRAKKEQVAEMFDNIAHSYDQLNHVLSFGIDILWRKKAIRMMKKLKPKRIMDVATGTGDFAIEAARMGVDAEKIIGVDISNGMLDIGREKLKKKGLDQLIELKYGDSENLPFEDDYFDAYTAAFGVRNFENLEKGLTEMLRVLRPGATGFILEFSKPRSFPFKQLYWFYFKAILPIVGRLFSKDSRAYTYLPESVAAFPEGDEFLEIMKRCGYTSVERKALTGGIATIYTGKKG